MLAQDSAEIILPIAVLTIILFALTSFIDSSLLTYFFGTSLLFTGFTLYFFRDPQRKITQTTGFLAPTDGRVFSVSGKTIGVHLSLFNVHVTRAPCEAIITKINSYSGKFVPAYFKGASQNEREEMFLRTDFGDVKIVRYAGIFTRRIMTWVSELDVLSPGQKTGIIRFGSRCDITIPPTMNPTVKKGQKLKGGITVIAESE